MMKQQEVQRLLQQERERFRASLQALGDASYKNYDGRIGVVLSGGGARGAYEAGALLAFQDAELPTHILAASSVGSVNAACYAASSKTNVGNAEALVESWIYISPTEVGIDWSRYVFMLGGLVAAMAGLFNALWLLLDRRGITLRSQRPILTWLALMLTGMTVLLLFDQLPYLLHVVSNWLRGGRWRPDPRKALRSLYANLVVLAFLYLFLNFTDLYVAPHQKVEFELSSKALGLALAALAGGVYYLIRARLSGLSHKFLRLPLRSGLFANYERAKFLRALINGEGLKQSPMRVVITATDIAAGAARYFTNTPVAELAGDPEANRQFVANEVEQPQDLVQAVIASSAFTIAYEAVPMEGRLWTDGGVVTNQPIRPAVRLGADVLFLVMVEPPQGQTLMPVRTFLDVGVRAIDILIDKNLKADLKQLDRINSLCSNFAAEMKMRPEEAQLEVGAQSYKYVKAFTVWPQQPLEATALDFDGKLTGPAILQGYRDGQQAVREFQEYCANLPKRRQRRMIRLVADALGARVSRETSLRLRSGQAYADYDPSE
jgi:predicted acylesterase/phospholipase RssA